MGKALSGKSYPVPVTGLVYIEKGILCVLIRTHQWGDSNENTQHIFYIENQRGPYYASWPGAMTNTH